MGVCARDSEQEVVFSRFWRGLSYTARTLPCSVHAAEMCERLKED